MKICLHAFHTAPHSETGWSLAQAFVAVCAKLHWDYKICLTSQEVMDYAPDLVLSMSYMAPKLTPYPTIAVLWNSSETLRAQSQYIRYVLSCDGVLAPSDTTREFAEDILYAAQKDVKALSLPPDGDGAISPDHLKECLPQFLSPSSDNGAQFDDAVNYLVRIGGRPTSMIRRAMDSLANQTHKNIRPILLAYKQVEGIAELLADYKSIFPDLRYLENFASTSRSNTLWLGLQNLEAPYFGILDDDDALHPNHVHSLLEKLKQTDTGLSYAGVIRVIENQNAPGRFPTGQEHRDLAFLEPYLPNRILNKNFITSNSWLAETTLVDTRLRRDPNLNVAEDFYLLLELLERTDFTPSWQPTSEFYWRIDDENHSRDDRQAWNKSQERILRRLMFNKAFHNHLGTNWNEHAANWNKSTTQLISLIVQDGDTLDDIQNRYPEYKLSAHETVVQKIQSGNELEAGDILHISLQNA